MFAVLPFTIGNFNVLRCPYLSVDQQQGPYAASWHPPLAATTTLSSNRSQTSFASPSSFNTLWQNNSKPAKWGGTLSRSIPWRQTASARCPTPPCLLPLTCLPTTDKAAACRLPCRPTHLAVCVIDVDPKLDKISVQTNPIHPSTATRNTTTARSANRTVKMEQTKALNALEVGPPTYHPILAKLTIPS